MKSRKAGVDRNVFFMGLASFFNDISSEMILPLLPLFLTNVLGAGQAIVGLIEGVGDSTSSVLKLVSGWLSDKFDRRKPLVLFGYTASNLVKPLLALADSWPFVLVIKFADRVGKGIRTSPRDALISVSTRQRSGASFGFHRMMDTSGAIIGVVVAFVLLYFLSMSFQAIFLLTVIPGALAVLTIAVFVKEKKVKGVKEPVKFSLKPFGGRFKRFIIVSVLFGLGNFSYAFLLLRTQDIGLALALVPLMYLFYNVVYALVSMPVGRFSDRVGKVKTLSLGMLLFVLVSLGFGFTDSLPLVLVLFALYGVFQAVYEISSRAYIPELVEARHRGTAYGIYHTSMGLVAFPASFVVGSLWQFVGVEAAFGFAAALALASALLLLVWVRE